MQEAIRAEKEKHDKLVQEMRGKYKGSQESWASRLNDTLKLKDNLERKVKDLECEVEKLQPVRSFAPCVGVPVTMHLLVFVAGHTIRHAPTEPVISQFTIPCSHMHSNHTATSYRQCLSLSLAYISFFAV